MLKGLVTLILSTEPTLFLAELLGENDLVMLGTAGAAAPTVKFAVLEAALATGVCVLVTPLAVFGLVPAVVLVTCTVTVQPPAGTPGISRFKAVAPTVSAGELVTSAQVPVMALEAIFMLISVSVKVTLLSGVVLVLPMVKVSALVPPLTMLVGANALLMLGALDTVKVAVLLAKPAPRFELNTLLVLGFTPAVMPVTGTSILHEKPAANVPPVKLKALPPVMVSVPPHTALVPLTAVTPAGSVSVKASALTALMLGLALESVKRILLVAPVAINAGVKDLLMAGLPVTATAAVGPEVAVPAADVTVTLFL